MLRSITIFSLSILTTFLVNSQKCPDDINNSPGNSGNTANAIVYDSGGNVIQTITCDATGNSGQIDCDLDSYNFPAGSYIAIDFSNGPNTTTCYYDANGELIEDNIGLPVDFGGLKVENNGGANLLKWITFSERNNSFFKLEYSSDGIEWQEIAQVDGAGNSNTTLDYSTTHKKYKSGINYYRLSQQDMDGELTFLTITSIENKSDFEIIMNSGEINIYSNKEIKSIQCYAMNGKIVNQEIISNDKYQAMINLHNYSNSIILMNIVFSDGSSEQKKVFVG